MSYRLQKLQVTNFRNLSSDVIEFCPTINCIFGENGNGKTNILEAIYVLANKKSFRKNASFPQFLGIDGAKPEILFSSVVENGDGDRYSYSARCNIEQMQFYLNGQMTKKTLALKTVLINPFDSHHFHHTKAFRRQWFDHYISLVNPDYKQILSKYNTALKFKNALLDKRPVHYEGQIQAIHLEMAKYTFLISEHRKKFLSDLSAHFEKIFEQIFSEKHHLTINLESNFANLSEQECLKFYQAQFSKDKLASRSTCGVHRDDYVLLLNSLNSYDYSSLGQQKMSYLSLLFATIELFRYKFSSFPIVLIDDVSGELDQERWKRLMDYLKRGQFQVLITTANEKFREELERIDGVNKLVVVHGNVKKV